MLVAQAAAEGDLLRAMAHPLGALARAETEDARKTAVALARSGPPRAARVLARAERFRRVRADALSEGFRARFTAAVERVSATSLTAGRACLHRFFLLYVAKVGEDDASFSGPGFDRPVFGAMIHDMLEQAVREPDASPAELARAAVERREDALTDPAVRAWALTDLERIARLFRLRETAAAPGGYAPMVRDLEWRFGRGGAEVRLGAGDGIFHLQGAVDRLDVDDPARPRHAIVVDYKTSVTGASGGSKSLLDTEDLQLPLYAAAIEGLRGVRVVGVEHYTAARRGRWSVGSEIAAGALKLRAETGKAKILEESDFRAVLEKALRAASAVVAAVRRGEHAKAPLDRDACTRCSVRPVCRADPSLYRARRDDPEGDA